MVRVALLRSAEAAYSGLSRRDRVRVEQAVNVYDEGAHVGIVHRAMRGTFPRLVRFGIARVDADHVELAEIGALQVSSDWSSPPNTRCNSCSRLAAPASLMTSVPLVRHADAMPALGRAGKSDQTQRR